MKARKKNSLAKGTPKRISRDLHIAELRATGKSVLEIAKETSLSHQRVSQILSDKQIKEILEEAQRYYISKAPEIKENFIKLCMDENKKISLDAIKEWHKITGIAPSQIQSQFLQQIYVDNRTISPETMSNLEKMLALKREQDLQEDIEKQNTEDSGEKDTENR